MFVNDFRDLTFKVITNIFWHTVKPFLSQNSTGGQQKIVLMENDVILNDKKSSFHDIYFVDQFSYSVCVCWFEIEINVVLWSVFSDTVYARVVVFIKDNSFTNIILAYSQTIFVKQIDRWSAKNCFNGK
jgi:hypothetical protein